MRSSVDLFSLSPCVLSSFLLCEYSPCLFSCHRCAEIFCLPTLSIFACKSVQIIVRDFFFRFADQAPTTHPGSLHCVLLNSPSACHAFVAFCTCWPISSAFTLVDRVRLEDAARVGSGRAKATPIDRPSFFESNLNLPLLNSYQVQVYSH